jgi:DNA (cytosine-5)-methyltransferase 1
LRGAFKTQLICPGYKIYSLVVEPDFDKNGNPILQQKDYVIHAEKFGIPQTRHRVILLGIRHDIDFVPRILEKVKEVPISKVLSDLPRLRGGLSKIEDSDIAWKDTVNEILSKLPANSTDKKVRQVILNQLSKIRIPRLSKGAEYISYKKIKSEYRPDWFNDPNLEGVCNHSARGHMESDLHRYFYIACFAHVYGFSPNLDQLPTKLLPTHKNVFKKDGNVTGKFPDRFRVQLNSRPAKTITSHISQDGHYYIHYDPKQCRSLTVREAARIQTFPDNYFFCGPRTHQFIQVGNAVPPILANNIAQVVIEIFNAIADPNLNVRLIEESNALAAVEAI